MSDARLRAGLGLTWFRSVSSVYSGSVWSLPGPHSDQVRWSSGHGRAVVSCQVASHMLGPRQGMLTHGAMSDVSAGGGHCWGKCGVLGPHNDVL